MGQTQKKNGDGRCLLSDRLSPTFSLPPSHSLFSLWLSLPPIVSLFFYLSLGEPQIGHLITHDPLGSTMARKRRVGGIKCGGGADGRWEGLKEKKRGKGAGFLGASKGVTFSPFSLSSPLYFLFFHQPCFLSTSPVTILPPSHFIPIPSPSNGDACASASVILGLLLCRGY